MKKNILSFVTLFAILALFLSACGNAPQATPAPAEVGTPDEVIAEGRLEPIRATNLSFQVRGVVEQVLVKAGDTVSEGDVLARLANAGAAEAQLVLAQNAYDLLIRNASGERARLWQAYMETQVVRAQAEKKWEDLNVTAIEDRIEDAQAEIEDRKADLEDAQKEFDKYKDLDQDNSKRKNAEDDLEQAQEDLNQAMRDLEKEMRDRDTVRAAYEAALAAESEAKYQYEISLDGPNADQLAFAKANLDAANDALSNYVLAAPFAGVVADVNVKAGEQVGAETRAVSIADFSAWGVETTDVTELEVVKLVEGQKVIIRPDALSDLQLKGSVIEISNAYTQLGGDILYTVRIRVDETDSRLRWGMTVEIVFLEQVSD
ncbi:MAG TPA: HlyD family efflux transporter periplasmic adaptor subunit [Anaerolineales bacterium]|nr:HlyD family efflux transporter periplasmic adaptor subunit [Anaerolineales bacterium]